MTYSDVNDTLSSKEKAQELSTVPVPSIHQMATLHGILEHADLPVITLLIPRGCKILVNKEGKPVTPERHFESLC